MQIDLLGAIALTLGAAIVTGVLVGSDAGSRRDRLRLLLVLAAWFALVVLLGAANVFDNRLGYGTPALGIAVVLPIVLAWYAAARSATARSILSDIPLPALVGANAVRILGVFFVLLHAGGRLPAPFAPAAGWGDIAVGATALPLAWAVAGRSPGWRWAALAWNALGTIDLCTAIGLGIASAEGSPVRLFFAEPSSALMADLPWLLIPAYLVPLLMITHLALFYRLTAAAGRMGAVHV